VNAKARAPSTPRPTNILSMIEDDEEEFDESLLLIYFD
jgi:hypothetical protein